MKKASDDSWDYTLEIPYHTDEEWDEIIDDIISEASSIADSRNGFMK